MTITKTVFAAALLAVMGVSAQAQQGPSRQIQVLPAPAQVVQVTAASDTAPIEVETAAPDAAADIPAAEAEPAPQVVTPSAPRLRQKEIVAAPEALPEPRFAAPRAAPPARKASFHTGGYRSAPRSNCH